MCRHSIFLISLLLSFIGANAADIQVDRTDGEPSFITVDGEFVEGDVEKFNNIAIGEKSAIVVFNSPGGLAWVGMEIGTTIHIKGFSTAVIDGSMCASSCGLAWLAGHKRLVSEKGLVGFHAVHTVEAGKTDISSAGNAVVGAYLQRLGLGYDVTIYVTKESPEKMQWLTEADAERLDLSVKFMTAPKTAWPTDNQGGPAESTENKLPRKPPIEPSAATVENSPVEMPNPKPFIPTPQWQLIEHADLDGNDLPGMPFDSVSAEFCQVKCMETKGCVAFTQNIKHEKCFLKSGYSEALQYTGATSGYLGAVGSVTRIGKDPGPEYKFRTGKGHEITSAPVIGFHDATLGWCQDACIDQKECVAFNFYPNGDCMFMSAKKPVKVSNGVYHGFKMN